jgi:hypothetical protein
MEQSYNNSLSLLHVLPKRRLTFNGLHRITACFMLVSCLAYSSALKIVTTCSFETSVDFQQTIRRYTPEGSSFIKRIAVLRVKSLNLFGSNDNPRTWNCIICILQCSTCIHSAVHHFNDFCLGYQCVGCHYAQVMVLSLAIIIVRTYLLQCKMLVVTRLTDPFSGLVIPVLRIRYTECSENNIVY